MARGRWLKKMGNRIQDRLEEHGLSTDDYRLPMTASSLSQRLGDLDLGPTVDVVQTKAKECDQVARATMELCESTKVKSEAMVAFGSELQQTLSCTNMDASTLETIRDLTDGSKVQQAMTLAKDMNGIAMECVTKSMQMMDLMEDAMDDLPAPLEKLVDSLAAQDASEEEQLAVKDLETLDQDVEDVQACIRAMQDWNLSTAFTIGLEAFQQLSGKAQRSRSMFATLQGFSTTVSGLTQDLVNLDVVSLSSKLKDILKCIRLTEVMRALAQGAQKILQILMDLFQATSQKISTLWSALAFCKECMSDCMDHVTQAKARCVEAQTQSRSLLDTSESVRSKMQNNVGPLNRQSWAALTEMREEIPMAMELARNMDDLVVDCTDKVTSMVERVAEGFKNLPPVITDGITMEEEGKDEQDPDPADVEADIAELEASRAAMEEADVFAACKSGAAGFSSISKKTELCSTMLVTVQEFTANCDKAIESFMGVWDLNSAIDKIKDMCRLVSMGELIKQFANQVKKLLLAIVALMKSTHGKLSSIEMKDLVSMDSVSNAADKVDDFVGDKVGDLLGDKVGDLVGDGVGAAMGKVTGKLGGLFK